VDVDFIRLWVGTNGREFLKKNLKGKDHLEDLGVDSSG